MESSTKQGQTPIQLSEEELLQALSANALSFVAGVITLFEHLVTGDEAWRESFKNLLRWAPDVLLLSTLGDHKTSGGVYARHISHRSTQDPEVVDALMERLEKLEEAADLDFQKLRQEYGYTIKNRTELRMNFIGNFERMLDAGPKEATDILSELRRDKTTH